MFAHCKGPLWQRDDLSLCFRVDYLQTLIPLLSCGASIVLILAQYGIRKSRQRQGKKKDQTLVDIDQEGEPEGDTESLSDLTLQRSVSHADQSFVDLDKPTGKVTLVAIELLAVLGLLALGVVLLFARSINIHSEEWRIAVVEITVWTYVAILVALRLFVSTSGRQLPVARLWNHTTSLYAIQWLMEIWIFRSVFIHTVSHHWKILSIIRFTLVTVLLLIVCSSRKGNREVILEYEGDIEPSHEPLASILSLATFSWVDPIIWRGYKKTLEMADVWNVALKDKSEIALARFRQVQKTHSLAFRLLIRFKMKLFLQGAWCVLSSILMFLPTLLLKSILEYLEDPESIPASAAWLYVILLFISSVLQAIGEGQALWIGRKICIHLRAIIVGEIYSKTLRRKAAASTRTDLGDQRKLKRPKLMNRLTSIWQRQKDQSTGETDAVVSKTPIDAQVNNGTIINLMSIDSFKVADICSYLHFLWPAVPVQLAMAIGLLYKILGYSSFVGIGLMVLILPLNLFIAKSFQSAQKKIMAATDGRIEATNEVLQNIRIIKYFAWEQRFHSQVNEKRQTELAALWRKYIIWSSAATIWSGIPILITFVSFLIYTTVEKRPLVPSTAFPALSMFSLLRVPLDQLADMVAHVQESKVSVDRVDEFLKEEETEKYVQQHLSKQNAFEEPRIALEKATLTWGSKTAENDLENQKAFRLINMDVDFMIGKLNVIAGPTGSGKTSLLMALLGEMKLIEGNVCIPGGYARQELRPEAATGLTESIAYCAQQAWLVNATIQENILFASPFDANRYDAVIEVCALGRDLEILDAGDQTLVGEKGITLSGGQKQRISLARAIYCNSKHLFLDDCLSAVDSHTAKHIFRQALSGTLMMDRTCILVSHNVALTVPSASFVVVLNNGKIVTQGTPLQVMQSGELGDELARSVPGSKVNSTAPSRVSSNLEEERSKLASSKKDMNGSAHAPNKTVNGNAQNTHKSDKNFVDPRMETKAVGRVKLTTIQMYLRAMGPWYYWIFAASGFVATQVSSVASNVWIRQWANSYHVSKLQTKNPLVQSLYAPNGHFDSTNSGLQLFLIPQTTAINDSSLFSMVQQHVDVKYYLGIYALIGGVYVLICFARELILFWGSLHASTILHERLLRSILHAKFKFFDSTPHGQLTNRFSKDIQAIDQEVAPVATGMFHSAASVITIVILISVITPGFLLPGFFIALMYVATGLFYVRSSRDLKRIEAVQRSPLFQHFGETLSGVVTIRAYGDESRFVQESHQRVNAHNRPFLLLWATNRWLALRVGVAGAFVSFFSAVFVVTNAQRIDAGAAGLSLSYAINFSQNVFWLVRLYANNEQNMNAVERVQEYINIDQEAPARVPENEPPANWPSHGSVEFINYSTRYRSDLNPVLKNVTFRVQAAEKVGIVGRTGAGKSSLALALFRGLEAEDGNILIDDINIGFIGLQNLREAITIVPQDPTLFTGTLRSNLDPFDRFTDEEIFTALQRVQLISGAHEDSDRSDVTTPDLSSKDSTFVGNGNSPLPQNGRSVRWGDGSSSSDPALSKMTTNFAANKNIFRDLKSPVAESGSNLSQGQRQLLCLARALLKSPKVLVMDEATASIDYNTDSKIQNTLRALKNNTIITIAHRLQTIIDYDKVLVLERGEVVEFAHPWELIQKEDGFFRNMCEINGDYETLVELAKKAWQDKRLIDDS